MNPPELAPTLQPCQLRGLWGKGVFAQALRVLPTSAFPLLLVCPLEPPVWMRKPPQGQVDSWQSQLIRSGCSGDKSHPTCLPDLL